MMAKIAIDIDSTLYDFASLACQTMGRMSEEISSRESSLRLRNAAYSTTWTEWRTPIDLAGEELWNDVVDRCHEPEVILAQTPYAGAREELWDLYRAGHELAYVSNRSRSTERATADWLTFYAFPFGPKAPDAWLICHHDDKLASIRDCRYLIDDRPKTLVQFIHYPVMPVGSVDEGAPVPPDVWSERKAFGLVTPYNRNLTDVPGIYLAPSWPLLGRYLKEKIPAPGAVLG